MTDRITLLMDKTAHALRAMRKAPAGERDKYSQALANIWLRDLGETERAFMLATAAKAAPPHVVDEMVYDMGGPVPLGKI